ncbi:non-homologous end-joining DNA ligase LigD [Streptomyces prunicolor]|uniref:non-homologous end-joining DNA ligase LigD n=1 Tax=Streptomyces prunicolor TaxID=67348 RepID=UPI003571021E
MLPHLRGRPLMLERHPEGIDGPAPGSCRGTSRSATRTGSNASRCPRRAARSRTRCATTPPLSGTSPTRPASPRTAGCPGPTGSTRTDRLVFDLGPSTGDDFAAVRQAALLLRELLDELCAYRRAPPRSGGSSGGSVRAAWPT